MWINKVYKVAHLDGYTKSVRDKILADYSTLNIYPWYKKITLVLPICEGHTIISQFYYIQCISLIHTTHPSNSRDFFGNTKSVRDTLLAVCSTPINVYPSCRFSVK